MEAGEERAEGEGADPRTVAFDALPRPVRERLVASLRHEGEPQPVLEELLDVRKGVLGFGALALAAGSAFGLFLALDFGHSRLPWSAFNILVGLLGASFAGVLGAAQRRGLEHSLPYAPGRYLLPLDFVDARSATLRVIPLDAIRDARVVQKASDPKGGATLTLVFEGGEHEVFEVAGKKGATAALAKIKAHQEATEAAHEADDEEALRALDPFFEVRAQNAWGRPAPAVIKGPAAGRDGVLARPLMRSLIALGLAAAVSAPALWARNKASDDAMFQAAVKVGDEASLRRYLERGGDRHAAEVTRELLPRAALADAVRAGTVTALRDFLAKYPGSAIETDARAALHEAYARALAAFEQQASTSDAQLVPFMRRLLAWLEAHDLARVEARFESPSSAMLEMVDTMLQDPQMSRGAVIAKVGPHFDSAHAKPREAAIVKSLSDGFATVFSADVMHVEPGGRTEIDAPPEGDAGAGEPKRAPPPRGALTVPTVDVKYKIGWSGDVYGEDKAGARKFVGIVFQFDVAMRIPGDEEPFAFTLGVKPPDEFNVRFGGDDDEPSDGKVYDQMAARAFDQLGEKLRHVLFRPGTKGYDASRGEPPSASPR